MKITLSTNVLNSIDTKKFDANVPAAYQQYYHLEAGKEHYRLLIYIASLFDDVVLADIGTNHGASALALSTNPRNSVYSVDVVNIRSGEPTLSNTRFEVGNFIHDSNIFDRICEAKVIMLDIDHEYHNEIQLYDMLCRRDWQGIMLCDDIHLNEPMKRFWSEVKHLKLDITKYGHGSGTGVIVMDNTEFELT